MKVKDCPCYLCNLEREITIGLQMTTEGAHQVDGLEPIDAVRGTIRRAARAIGAYLESVKHVHEPDLELEILEEVRNARARSAELRAAVAERKNHVIQ